MESQVEITPIQRGPWCSVAGLLLAALDGECDWSSQEHLVQSVMTEGRQAHTGQACRGSGLSKRGEPAGRNGLTSLLQKVSGQMSTKLSLMESEPL